MSDQVQVEYVDRYSATGRPYPKKLTVCGGQCEGMGCYPVWGHEPLPSYYEKYPHMVTFVRPMDEMSEYESSEVERIRAEEGDEEDGTYFVKCPDCKGTGKIPLWRGLRRIPREIGRSLSFIRNTIFEVQPGWTLWQNVRMVLGIAVRGWF